MTNTKITDVQKYGKGYSFQVEVTFTENQENVIEIKGDYLTTETELLKLTDDSLNGTDGYTKIIDIDLSSLSKAKTINKVKNYFKTL